MVLAKKKCDQASVEELMERIRSKVSSEQKRVSFKPVKVKTSSDESPVHSDELAFLNANWANWSTAPEITSHRRFIGPIIVKLKTKFVHIAWKYLLKDYFEKERQFQMNLVRHLNAQAKYTDDRLGRLFWDVVKKVDNDIEGVNDRADYLLDSAFKEIDRFRIAASKSEADFRNLENKVFEVEQIVKGLESILAVTSRKESETPDPLEYLLLENRYRGSREVIAERNSAYLPYFSTATKPVLDIGCGRGEFLELLTKEGLKAQGVDLDSAMIEQCRDKGLEASLADGMEFIASAPENSFGGIIATQVVEHLSAKSVEKLVAESFRVLENKGSAIFETINPTSLVALSNNFFRDPTHIKPVHPETLKFQMELQGFTQVEIIYSAKFPEESLIQELPLTGPASNLETVEHINQVIKRLNSLLFGFQDYAVVGRKP